MKNPDHTGQVLTLLLGQLFQMQCLADRSPTNLNNPSGITSVTSVFAFMLPKKEHVRHQARSASSTGWTPFRTSPNTAVKALNQHWLFWNMGSFKEKLQTLYLFKIWLNQRSTVSVSRNLACHRDLMHNKYVYAGTILFKTHTYICSHLCCLAATKINKNCTAFLKDRKHLTPAFFNVKVPISPHISQNMALLLTLYKWRESKY